MSNKLPKITKSIYTLKAPSDGREVKYRALTVREEKILLIAQQASRDLVAKAEFEKVTPEEVMNSAKGQIIASAQVVGNCVIDDKYEALDMPAIDFEYLMVAIRSRGVGNTIEFKINGKDAEGNDTKKTAEVDVNLDEVKIVRDENHSNKIQISEDMTLIMRYSTMAHSIKRLEGASNPEASAVVKFEIMRDCLESIVTGDSIYHFDDQSEEEVNEWVDDLDDEALQKINEFFNTSPFLRYEFPYADPETGEEKTLVVQGFESFFI